MARVCLYAMNISLPGPVEHGQCFTRRPTAEIGLSMSPSYIPRMRHLYSTANSGQTGACPLLVSACLTRTAVASFSALLALRGEGALSFLPRGRIDPPGA